VTLKLGIVVTKMLKMGPCNRLYTRDLLLVCHCKHSSILYDPIFEYHDVKQYRHHEIGIKITQGHEDGTIRKPMYSFLFAFFHSIVCAIHTRHAEKIHLEPALRFL